MKREVVWIEVSFPAIFDMSPFGGGGAIIARLVSLARMLRGAASEKSEGKKS